MKFFKIIICSILPLISFSQTMNKEVKAKIEVNYSEDLVLIKGTAENLTDVYKSISYKLSVIKNGGKTGNQSTNAQSGRETLEPEKIKDLSKTQININNEDEIVLLLLIYDEKGNIIGKDRIALGEKKKTEKIADGLELTGIISDETKTKNGKDFYDLFYSEYNKINKKGNKIVTVSEELTIARSTKLMISIENELITEFMLRPDEDYLSAMAQESASLVFKYFKNLERQSQQIIRY
jgi:hypothetical protein